MDTEKGFNRWDMKSWLWVLLCTAGIFSAVPLARTIQRYIYEAFGRDFFTYFVLLIVFSGLIFLLYYFIFRLKSHMSQYIWLFSGTGFYIYVTLQLRKHPEEAIHLLEFGLLAFLVFKALSHRVRDWTVYLTSALIVAFIGAADEFFQWLIPERIWDFRDVNINMLAGSTFLITVWKGVRPDKISGRVSTYSVRLLTGIAALNLLFLGICLSNTPGAVNHYTSLFGQLSWLKSEETMAEYGYKHHDRELGGFFSRFTLEELREMDRKGGKHAGETMLENINPESDFDELIKTYNPYTNTFLYEFLIHVFRRDYELETFIETKSTDSSLKAFKEQRILEKYFGNTLRNSRYELLPEGIEAPDHEGVLLQEDYDSEAGRLITLFSLKTARTVCFVLLFILFVGGEIWKRKIDTRSA